MWKRLRPHRPPIVSAAEAVADIASGASLLVGGFGLCGIPEALLRALAASTSTRKNGGGGWKVISDSGGTDEHGVGHLLNNHQVQRMISSYIGPNREFHRQYLAGELAVEFRPQGTLAEAIRCGGAGIPAFWTPTGVGTELVELGGYPVQFGPDGSVREVSQPRRVEVIQGRKYLLEHSLRGDYALVKAKTADTHGNLVYHGTARNFNPIMATAAKITIAEVEEIVEAGQIHPNDVHTPGIFVQRIVKSPSPIERLVEHLTFFSDGTTGGEGGEEGRSGGASVGGGGGGDINARIRIAKRGALEFQDGMYCNLGIGIPTLAANFVPPDITLHLQSENGLLGMGPFPLPGVEDPDLINAGKETVTMLPGASLFSSDVSFGMIRSDHLDLTLLGGLQVDQEGNLANWTVPGKRVMGPGGAMDLVAGGSRVVVLMHHETRGVSKVVRRCTLPLTGIECVRRLITEYAVFDLPRGKAKPRLVEIYRGIPMDALRGKTGFDFDVATDLKLFE